MRRAAALIALVAISGCGGGSPPAGSETPEDILRAAQQAMAGVGSYHIDGTQRDARGTWRIAGDVALDGARLVLRQEAHAPIQITIVGTTSYVLGTREFWEDTGGEGQVLDLLVGRWVKMPAEDTVDDVLDYLRPKTIAACLGQATGTLRAKGTAEVGGQKADVIVSAGDKPGSAPGELYVAADEPRVPLRLVQTGPQKPGGPKPDPRCEDEEEADDTQTLASDITLSQFDEPVTVEAPPGALDLEELEDQVTGESTV